MYIRSHYIGITTLDKWRAVAAQTARCRCKVISIQYVLFIILGPIKGSGTEDKLFAEKSGNYIRGQSPKTLVIQCK